MLIHKGLLIKEGRTVLIRFKIHKDLTEVMIRGEISAVKDLEIWTGELTKSDIN